MSRAGRWRWSVGVAVVALVTAACSSTDDSSAVRTVQAEFTVPAGTSAADAARTAAVMQARYRALGAADTDVDVRGRRLHVSGPAAVRRFADAVAGRGELAFRPVEALFTPGIPVTEADGVLPSADPTSDLRYQVGPPGLVGGVEAARAYDQGPNGGGWVVAFTPTPEGTKAFNRMARDQYDQPPPQNSVAFVLDGRVQSAPAFMTSSFDGDVQISGNFTQREAEQLAVVLRSGAYPVAVTQVR